MTKNVLPCGQCAHYDAGAAMRAGKPSRLGWCSVKSVYPSEDVPGRAAPRGVKRAEPGALPRPKVVAKAQIFLECTQAQKAAAAAPITKEQLLQKARGGR